MIAPLTPTTVPYVDGQGSSREQAVSRSGDTSPVDVPWNVLADPATGLALGTQNPFPTEGRPRPLVSSEALGASLVVWDGPCYLHNIHVNTTSDSGWALLLDATSVPVDGAVLPVMWWRMSANDTLDLSFLSPIEMSAGAVLVFSADTDPFTLTSSATALFAAQRTAV